MTSKAESSPRPRKNNRVVIAELSRTDNPGIKYLVYSTEYGDDHEDPYLRVLYKTLPHLQARQGWTRPQIVEAIQRTNDLTDRTFRLYYNRVEEWPSRRRISF